MYRNKTNKTIFDNVLLCRSTNEKKYINYLPLTKRDLIICVICNFL